MFHVPLYPVNTFRTISQPCYLAISWTLVNSHQCKFHDWLVYFTHGNVFHGIFKEFIREFYLENNLLVQYYIISGFLFQRHTVCLFALKSGGTGINIGMGSANERRCYIVTSFLIGRAHTQNDPIGWAHTQNDPLGSGETTWISTDK